MYGSVHLSHWANIQGRCTMALHQVRILLQGEIDGSESMRKGFHTAESYPRGPLVVAEASSRVAYREEPRLWLRLL